MNAKRLEYGSLSNEPVAIKMPANIFHKDAESHTLSY